MEIGGIDSQFMLNNSYSSFEAALNTGKDINSGFADRLKAVADFSAEKSSVSTLPKKDEIDKDSKLFEMCRELETFLIKNLISSMRNTVQKTGLMDSGFAGKFYEDMLYDEYAKSFANNAGLGFAEMAYQELSRKSHQLGEV